MSSNNNSAPKIENKSNPALTTAGNTAAASNDTPAANNNAVANERQPSQREIRGRENTQRNVDAGCLFIIKVILAIIFPPIAVALEKGCECDTWLNILLTICGYFPGLIHAFYVILHCGDPVD